MSQHTRWIVALMVMSTSAVIAEVSVNFTADPRFVESNRLRVNGSLFLDFAIDHSGQVTMDASVAKENPKNVITTVDGWDGVVGTVASPSLFNSSFTLTANGWKRNNSGSDYALFDISISGDGPGYLGIIGQNSTSIDGSSSPSRNREMLAWTLTTGTTDLVIDMKSFDWDGKGDSARRGIIIFDNEISNSWSHQPEAGFMNISGYIIENGEPITFTLPDNAISGYGLSGFIFEVLPSLEAASLSPKVVSGKPASLGLLTF